MKLLNIGNDDSQAWDKQLIQDLSFIKKNLRYPMRISKMLPLIFWSIFLMIVITLLFIYFFSGETKARIFPIVGFVFPCVILYRYIKSLQFIKIDSPYFLLENTALIERFLKVQHILVYRHPEAPEVLQIISKNISAGNKEDREIMIFIADDKQILVNSHFTNSGWSISPRSHAKMMGKDLEKFIRDTTTMPNDFHQKIGN